MTAHDGFACGGLGEGPVFNGEHKSLGDGSQSPNSRSNVAWPLYQRSRRHELVFHEDVLLASKRYNHAARGLGIHVASQSRLARPYGRALFGAVAAPFEQELVGIYDGVQLSREAKPYPYAERLLEWFCKHVDLLGSWAGVPARGMKRRHSIMAKEKSGEVFGFFQERQRSPATGRGLTNTITSEGPQGLDQWTVSS